MIATAVRIGFCPRCQTRLSVCRSCDNGQEYCGTACSTLARRDSLRVIRKRYRASQKGRENHRKAEQRRRVRRCSDDSVGDQGSQHRPKADTLEMSTAEHGSGLKTTPETTSGLACSVCGQPTKYILNTVDGVWRRRYRGNSIPRTRRRDVGF